MNAPNQYFFEPWDARLPFDLALGLEPVPDLLARYELTEEEFDRLKKTPGFMQQVVNYRAEIREKGLSFKEKARIMSEDLLTTAYEMIHTPTTPANVKADLVKWIGKMAGLEPAPAQQNNVFLLPAIAAGIQALPTHELEQRVAALVAKKQQSEPIDVTPTIQ